MRDAIAIVLFLASFAVIGLYWGIGVSGLPTNYSGIIWPVAFGMVVGGAVLVPFLARMQQEQPSQTI
jgi:hypothetical protein